MAKWFICAGMRRAASTVQYNIVKDIVEHNGGLAAGWVIEPSFPRIYRNIEKSSALYAMLKTHIFYNSLKPLFKNKETKAIYIYRDLRDVAVSLRWFYKNGKTRFVTLTESEAWKHILNDIEAIINEYNSWMSLPSNQIYFSRYEDILDEGLAIEMFRISGFMNLSWNMPPEAYSMKANQRIIDVFNDGRKRTRQQDPQSLFWVNHFSDGRVGKFKDQLTAKELAEVEAIAMPWLKDRSYI